LHGPAAAARLEQNGERRAGVLAAIFWHTVGNANWARTGRVLYMADFLEPGRPFDRESRARLAASVPENFEVAFRQVVKLRLGERIASGEALLPESIALWEKIQ
jgi:HD superfamily phosphohydrolase YqeK